MVNTVHLNNKYASFLTYFTDPLNGQTSTNRDTVVNAMSFKGGIYFGYYFKYCQPAFDIWFRI